MVSVMKRSCEKTVRRRARDTRANGPAESALDRRSAPPILPGDSHDVHAADAADLADRLNQLDADVDSLARLIRSALEPRDRRIRNMHAGDVLAHPLGGLCRAQRADAGENINLAE
jgi:hypothetical protein